jgi:hypothetical protein
MDDGQGLTKSNEGFMHPRGLLIVDDRQVGDRNILTTFFICLREVVDIQ